MKNNSHQKKNSYDIIERLDEEYSRPKEAIEIPSDYEGYDSNYEIESTINNKNISYISNKSTPHKKNISILSNIPKENKLENENFKSDIVKNLDQNKLRQKIQEQDSRLQFLEHYKFLCENRIIQQCPDHSFPLVDAHLKYSNHNENIFKNDDNYFHEKTEKYENIIFDLKQNVKILENKNKSLENKLNYYIDNLKISADVDKIENKIKINNFSNKNNVFPLPPEKIPNPMIRESYVKLYTLYNQCNTEKNKILETLKFETINFEEQKNYIEILKQTIDTFISKNDFSKITNCLKSIYNNNSENNTDELTSLSKKNLVQDSKFLFDLMKNKLDSEKYKKELVLAHVELNKLKENINNFNKNNGNVGTKKEKNIDNFENVINDLEKYKNKVRLLKNSNKDLNLKLEEKIKYCDIIKEDLKYSDSLIEKYKTELSEATKNINELNYHIETSKVLQNKIFDYKKSFDKIYLELDEALKEKKLIENEYKNFRNISEEKISELSKIKENFDSEEKELYLENKNLLNQIKLLEQINLEYKKNFELTENEIILCEEKLKNFLNEKKNSKNSNSENILNQHENYKISSLKRIENLQNNLDKLLEEITNLKQINENFINSKKDFNEELYSYKNQINFLEKNKKEIENEFIKKNNTLEKSIEQNQKLFNDYNLLEISGKNLILKNTNLTNEIIYWKEKYDKDIMNKINEIQMSNKENTDLKIELSNNRELININKK